MTRITIICSDYCDANLRKQPWRYFKELANFLSDKGHSVTIITDSPFDETCEVKYNLVHVGNVFTTLSLSTELVEIINKNSEVAIFNITPSTLYRGDITKNIKCPCIGVLTSSIYSPSDLMNIDKNEFVRNWEFIYRQLFESVLPRTLIKNSLNTFNFIVSLSEYNLNKINSIDIDAEIKHIPPGISSEDLELPAQNADLQISDKKPTILYFTSPLTLRGTDVLARAFCEVRNDVDSELVILSRPDNSKVVEEEQIIRNIICECGYDDDLTLTSEFLPPDLIRKYLSSADIVCLPYKIVLSDIPISLYEAQAMGTPVISTDVSSIPEAISQGGLTVPPSDVTETAKAIKKLLEDDELRGSLEISSRRSMLEHPHWEDIGEMFSDIVFEVADG